IDGGKTLRLSAQRIVFCLESTYLLNQSWTRRAPCGGTRQFFSAKVAGYNALSHGQAFIDSAIPLVVTVPLLKDRKMLLGFLDLRIHRFTNLVLRGFALLC